MDEKKKANSTSNGPSTTKATNGNGQSGTSTGTSGSNKTSKTVQKQFPPTIPHLGPKAIAISILSPGGSPTQSFLLYKLIRSLAKQHNVEVLTFAEDVAASAGYLLLCAGDEIYASPTSIVGSIGVVSQSFGVQHILKKLDLEVRLYTSGSKKVGNNPLMPEKIEDIERMKMVSEQIHRDFIQVVEESRGSRLRPEKYREPNKLEEVRERMEKRNTIQGKSENLSDSDWLSPGSNSYDTKLKQDYINPLFTGEFWTGTHALELGLIDGLIGSDDVTDSGSFSGPTIDSIIKKKYGDDVVLKDYSAPKTWIQRVLEGGSGDMKSAINMGMNGPGGQGLLGLNNSMIDPGLVIDSVTEELEFRMAMMKYGL